MDSEIKPKDCIHLANDIIIGRNLMIPRMTSLKDINYSFFQMVFEDIFFVNFFEMLPKKPTNKSQEIKFMAKILSYISEELFCISLDHIRAEDIVERNVISIHNLLEIISVFIKYIPKKFSKTKDLSIGSKSDSKCIQTNDEKLLKTKNLFRTFKELRDKRFKTLESTPSSSSSNSVNSSPLTPLESIPLILPQRRRSLRQSNIGLNSCIDSKKSNRKQEIEKLSKSIQTEFEPQMTPKRMLSSKELPKISPKEVSFDEYKRLKCENFATLLGHRLHETLKLKELTDSIEYKIKKYYGDVTAKTPQKILSKTSPKLRSIRKQSIRQKNSPQIRKTTIRSKPNLKSSSGTLCLDDLIKRFSEIPRNTIKTLKEQEKHQKKVLENLNKDVLVKESKVKSQLKDAIEAQEKRSQMIRNEIKQMHTLAETKGSKMSKIKENAAKRDSRLERVRIQKMIDNFQNELNSKYKRLKAIEEQIVLKEFEKRQKQQNESINVFRKNIKEKHSQELEKQKKMLESFETLYQHKYQMLAQNLTEEETRLKNEISSQTYYLRSLKREFDDRFAKDFASFFQT